MHDGFTPTYFAINVTLHENLKDCTPFSDFCSSNTMKIHTNSFSFSKSTIHVVSRRLKTGLTHLSNNKNRPRVNLLAFPGPFFDKCWYRMIRYNGRLHQMTCFTSSSLCEEP